MCDVRYVRAMKPSGLTYEDYRSWHLNSAALDNACRDWTDASKIIAHNLDRLERERRLAPTYLARCRELFEKGPEDMRSAFLALTEEGQVLRSIHPFAGLLGPDERAKILERTSKSRYLNEGCSVSDSYAKPSEDSE